MHITTDDSKRDQAAYNLAKNYLLSLDGVTRQILEKHLSSPLAVRPDRLAGIYQRLLESAQNANMGPNVIGKAIGGLQQLNCNRTRKIQTKLCRQGNTLSRGFWVKALVNQVPNVFLFFKSQVI